MTVNERTIEKCPHGWALHRDGSTFIHEHQPGKYMVCRKAEREAAFALERLTDDQSS